MNIGLNAAQARAKSSQDMIVFDENVAIMKQIISDTALGAFESYITDNTIMTLSTPVAVKQGTIYNPTVSVGDTVIIQDVTVVLGSTSTDLNGIICDINDAEIPGVVASKDSGYLVLTVELTASTVWTYTIGAGTANTAVGLIEGTYTIADTASVSYFNTWQGTMTDRALQNQMQQVMSHFNNLGYKIEQITNTTTAKTFKWHVYW